jgi:hypothetical protein
MKKHFHHGEHGGHGEEEKIFLIIRISVLHFPPNFFITPSSLCSVFSVSSVVKPLFSSLA